MRVVFPQLVQSHSLELLIVLCRCQQHLLEVYPELALFTLELLLFFVELLLVLLDDLFVLVYLPRQNHQLLVAVVPLVHCLENMLKRRLFAAHRKVRHIQVSQLVLDNLPRLYPLVLGLCYLSHFLSLRLQSSQDLLVPLLYLGLLELFALVQGHVLGLVLHI